MKGYSWEVLDGVGVDGVEGTFPFVFSSLFRFSLSQCKGKELYHPEK